MKTRKVVLDPGNIMLLVYTVIVALVIICGGFLQAEASELPSKENDSFNLDSVRQGELLVTSADGKVTPVIRLDQDVKITVSGIAARVMVSQEFINNGSEWLDGVYVFPLPDESAVDRLRMHIGDREIVGVIKEREEAKAIYEQAKAEGRKTSLLAQNRANIFTTRVANIGPGERIRIVIEYQQLVQYRDEVFSLRFPMAITPRYIPGKPLPGATERRAISFGAEGWAKDSDRVPDASAITPPVASPESGDGPRTTLSVDLLSGFPITGLLSLYHQMNIDELDTNHYSMAFTGAVLADRDFVVEWRPKKSEQATAALLAEDQDNGKYLLLMLMPPQSRPEVHVPREVIFILDASGSMAGPSIAQAKEALRRALKRLQPSDRFNVIRFSDTAQPFFATSSAATEEHLSEALSLLHGLEADGGTEMKPALELALDGNSSKSERIRQVIFLTDGAVGNEDELFALINAKLGESRLFTVGIGSAPNGYFMTRAATMGRGTYTYIGDVGEVESKMAELLVKLETPALTNISIQAADGSSVDFEHYPNPLPDLYFGEPLMVAVRTEKTLGSLTIAGQEIGRQWEYSVDTTSHGSRPGIAALWARKKIRSAMESLALGADEDSVKNSVLATALEHQLVSKYTSLVAVDTRVSQLKGVGAREEMVETAAPKGLQMDAVFGGGSRTATPSTLHILLGSLLLVIGASLQMVRRRRLWNR